MSRGLTPNNPIHLILKQENYNNNPLKLLHQHQQLCMQSASIKPEAVRNVALHNQRWELLKNSPPQRQIWISTFITHSQSMARSLRRSSSSRDVWQQIRVSDKIPIWQCQAVTPFHSLMRYIYPCVPGCSNAVRRRRPTSVNQGGKIADLRGRPGRLLPSGSGGRSARGALRVMSWMMYCPGSRSRTLASSALSNYKCTHTLNHNSSYPAVTPGRARLLARTFVGQFIKSAFYNLNTLPLIL